MVINIHLIMLVHSFINTLLLFVVIHVLIWFSTNSQFTSIEILSSNSLIINLMLSIPISLIGLYAAKIGYQWAGSIWAVRFLAFGTSYLVFPFLTWALLGETMLQPKTLICVGLSIAIILVQFYMQ